MAAEKIFSNSITLWDLQTSNSSSGISKPIKNYPENLSEISLSTSTLSYYLINKNWSAPFQTEREISHIIMPSAC